MVVIGGFRSDLSIARKTDGNFGNISTGVLFLLVTCQIDKKTQGFYLYAAKNSGY